ncbi:lysyl-tRNA synthetase class II [Modestobacter versicolor]|uniref:Lysyl-tRNA synthetase class II n=1 Tax=Modestobacter versicolor TaxID=429133 RepID=A0A323VDQ3_9ACTN|nr:lysyl-tRNA synthetase class II [Modestobacter versicolor]PZA23002.1 hypothetical protein DMO24_02255 [Modestobacter versicolor]
MTADRAADQRARRLAKLEALKARGAGAYPYRFPTDATAADVVARHDALPPGERTTERVRLAGRAELVRRQGHLTFAALRDRTGVIQLFVDTSVLGAGRHAEFDDVDRGDWLGVEGTVMRTRRGELSVCVGDFAVLGKALLEPPDKHRGLPDVETRYRQRYTDLEATSGPGRCSGSGTRPCAPSDGTWRTAASPRSRARSCRPSRAAPAHGRSSPTTTRSTWTSTCGSPSSCTSSG